MMGGTAIAQKCITDEVHQQAKAANPQIAVYEQQLEQQIEAFLKKQESAAGPRMRGTNAAWNAISGYDSTQANPNAVRIIPVVVHIIHNYGNDYVADSQIYGMMKRINDVYNKRNTAQLNTVIPTWREYIANMRFTFKLATIDPRGNPTNGIIRHYSYQANGGDEAAKLDPWPSDRYMNIWTESFIGRNVDAGGGIVLAYATYPSSGAANPYSDGLISRADATGTGGALDNTLEHEIGHYLNLPHTWGNGQVGVACGDDGVDDTPPTKGHFSTCPLYDTVCALGYTKNYVNAAGTPVIIDFPDTTNVQNIMDYSNCTAMFTIGQSMRMRAALESTVGRRRNLWQPANLAATGVLGATPDLAPIADFSVNKVFTCANTTGPNGQVTFTNRSYRDTLSGSAWSFSNGLPATVSTTNAGAVSFNQIGWVNAQLIATSNAGSDTVIKANAVYAANPDPVQAEGYYQEFDGEDVNQFPIFNYYDSSNYKWELVNNGFYDQKCIRFKNYDPRTNPTLNNLTLSPGGLYADFYTRAFDLSGGQFGPRAILNFYTAGAYRFTSTAVMNDSLEVYYSTNCGTSWSKILPVIARSAISSKQESGEFTPGGMGDWKLQGMNLPSAAKSNKTFFRFRYKPGVDNIAQSPTSGLGTGNHFYLDRINISNNALGMNTAELASRGVTLWPNPTNGAANVTIKGGDNSAAQVLVTDIAGRVVYRTEVRLTAAATEVELPAAQMSVKGMYLVQVIANGTASTHKLVVY